MYKLCVVVLAFLPSIISVGTPVRDCQDGSPLPDGVFFGSRETPCTAPPCQISRARGYAVTYVDFTPAFTTQRIRPRVRATVFGTVNITQVLPDEINNNPCGILTLGSCPLSGGAPAAYRLELPVDPSTPLIGTDTHITLFGDDDEVIFCYQVTTQLIP